MSEKGNDKENNQAVRRTCDILKALAGKAINGLTLKEIAEAIGANAPSTLRLLQTLEEEHLVTQYDSKRWALSMGILQIASATETELTRASARLVEMKARIAAGAAGINA